MQAVAHGWKPDKVKAPPKGVAEEFVEADKTKSGKLVKDSLREDITEAMGKAQK
jgi:hypothetical protein